MTARESVLVEKVARSLCSVAGGIPDALDIIKAVTKDMLPPDGFDANGQGGHFYWRRWAGQAQAAIDACHAKELERTLRKLLPMAQAFFMQHPTQYNENAVAEAIRLLAVLEDKP